MAKNRKETIFFAPVALVCLGVLLLSDPHCNRGCRTLGEHLLDHGIADFFRDLLA